MDYTANQFSFRMQSVEPLNARVLPTGILGVSIFLTTYRESQLATEHARIHHINLVVPDVDAAADRFAELLGVSAGEAEYLQTRGVKLRRFNLAGVWLVLVAPVTESSPAAAWLKVHGPGLFLLSFDAGAIDAKLAALASSGIAARGSPRNGLDDWRVADLDPEAFFGLPLQLTERRDNISIGANANER